MSDGENPSIKVSIKATASPKTDISSLKQELLGQYTARAQSILEKFPGVQGVQTQLNPSWAEYLFKRFPQQTERIQIEVKNQNT